MKYEPNFDNFRGPIDGFDPRDSSPSARNLQVLQRNLFENFFNGMESTENWDDVIDAIEGYLAWWKLYYCGVETEGPALLKDLTA